MSAYFSNEDRWELMIAGLTDLDSFIRRCISEGMGGKPDLFEEIIEQTAARMVDYKCGGVARRLRLLADEIKKGQEDWIAKVIHLFGQLTIIINHVKKSSLQEMNTHPLWLSWAGWNLKQELVLKNQPSLADEWMVMGIKTEKEENLRVQRTWFWGIKTKRLAMHLEYLVPFSQPAVYWIPGKIYQMSLTFYPGTINTRAIPGSVQKESFGPWPMKDGFTLDQSRAYIAEAIAYFPLVDYIPIFLRSAEIILDEQKNIFVGDSTGRFVETDVNPEYKWTLMALAGLQPISLFGEMTKGKFTILSCGFKSEFHRLT